MTQQETFDTVVRHLFTQGRPALRGNNCAYRGDGFATSCAVGCLIGDDEYKPVMDDEKGIAAIIKNERFGTGVVALIKANLLPKRLVPFEPLLSELQSVHDSTAFLDADGRYYRSSLRRRLSRVASDFQLNDHVLMEFVDELPGETDADAA
jgi:hypothetical protein